MVRGMESPVPRARISAGLLVKLGLLAAVVGAVGLLALRGVDVRGGVESALDWVRAAGPWTFFLAMAILPALGFPVSPFTLSAGPVFGPVMGLGWVIAASFAAITVNLIIGYSLARWAMHPLLERLMLRLGYKLPQVPPDQFRDWTILMRVTPGPPFVVQNFVLGLARVPLRIYLTVSVIVCWSYTLGFIVFGDALVQGKGRMAFLGALLLVAAITGLQLLRKHFARKRARLAATIES